MDEIYDIAQEYYEEAIVCRAQFEEQSDGIRHAVGQQILYERQMEEELQLLLEEQERAMRWQQQASREVDTLAEGIRRQEDYVQDALERNKRVTSPVKQLIDKMASLSRIGQMITQQMTELSGRLSEAERQQMEAQLAQITELLGEMLAAVKVISSILKDNSKLFCKMFEELPKEAQSMSAQQSVRLCTGQLQQKERIAAILDAVQLVEAHLEEILGEQERLEWTFYDQNGTIKSFEQAVRKVGALKERLGLR
jgi:uncharacterized phage infection (PIP) family protein YhgE